MVSQNTELTYIENSGNSMENSAHNEEVGLN